MQCWIVWIQYLEMFKKIKSKPEGFYSVAEHTALSQDCVGMYFSHISEEVYSTSLIKDAKQEC